MIDVRPSDAWSVGRFVLGTAGLGMAYGRHRSRGAMSEARAHDVLNTSWEIGLRSFDTAEAYGQSAERLSRWLTVRGVLDQAHVATKVKPAGGEIARTFDRATSRFRGAAGLTVLSHDRTDEFVWREFVGARGSRRVELGLSVYTAEDVIAVLQLPGVSRIQVPGNVFDHEAIDARAGEAIAMDIRSVFLQGVLLDSPDVAESRVAGAGVLAKAVRDAARDLGCPACALLIASIMHRCRPGDRVVVGADTPEDLTGIGEALELSGPTVEAFRDEIARSVPVPDRRILDPRRWAQPQVQVGESAP